MMTRDQLIKWLLSVEDYIVTTLCILTIIYSQLLFADMDTLEWELSRMRRSQETQAEDARREQDRKEFVRGHETFAACLLRAEDKLEGKYKDQDEFEAMAKPIVRECCLRHDCLKEYNLTFGGNKK